MMSVTAARPDQRKAALLLLFSRFELEEQARRMAEVLDAVERGELSLDGLLMAAVDGKPVGAVLYAAQSDRTAFLWPPVVSGHVAVDDVTDALLAEVCRRIDTAGARLGQCIVEPDDTADRQALSRNGFVHFADLSFLHRPLDEPLPPPADVEFETVSFDPASNCERFAALLERTYVDTLDCPALNDERTGAEALESHRTAGQFEPSRWKVYRVGGADVGVLLLSDHPDQDAWEVVYMGVAPEARGRGYGRAMLLCGLYEARAAGRGTVMLAVDNRNGFAKAVYNELAFVETAVRAVHVRMVQRRRTR